MEHRYEVYATRWDDPHIVEELIPARGLEFSMPLSEHGEASFTATVEPGKSWWRAAVALPFSGILIARDNVPVWQGWVTDERPAGPRSFTFQAREWGWFFEDKVPAVPRTWSNINDHTRFIQLLTDAQTITGQNARVQTTPTLGVKSSYATINAWDITTVGREQKAIAEAGGPEWYYGTTGTLENPVRRLFLGDRLGLIEAQTVLEYVEDTVDYRKPSPPPTVALLGDLYPGEGPLVPTRRAGGNLIAQGRTRTVKNAATVADGVGPGVEAGAILGTPQEATDLLSAGWPRMTSRLPYSDIMPAVNGRYYVPAVRDRLARAVAADLASRRGIVTTYSLISLDDDITADWADTSRGSTVRVVLDTDIYAGERPVGGPDGFDARLYDTIVRVSDSGPAQVEWATATVLED